MLCSSFTARTVSGRFKSTRAHGHNDPRTPRICSNCQDSDRVAPSLAFDISVKCALFISNQLSSADSIGRAANRKIAVDKAIATVFSVGELNGTPWRMAAPVFARVYG